MAGTSPAMTGEQPGNRKGSMAPLVFSVLAGGTGAAMLAFFINVGFDKN